MKFIYKNIMCGLLACLLLASCEAEDTREVFPHSTPVIESASINPSAFVYGDTVSINAKVSDGETPLSTLEVMLVSNDVLLAKHTVRTSGNSMDVSSKFKIAYKSQLPDNQDIEVRLTLTNVEGDKTVGTISGLKGKRKYFDKLYLVLETEQVIELTPEAAKSDKYRSEILKLKSKKIRYKVAEKLTPEGLIDFSGKVWGYDGNMINIIDETGDFITSEGADMDYVTQITFDTYWFSDQLKGEKFSAGDLLLDSFNDVTIGGEAYKKLTRGFTKNQELTLYGDLAVADLLFNMDYFDRTAEDKVVFKGDDGDYELYYNSTRMFVLVVPIPREFPKALLACGMGLGYPSKVKTEATTSWGFDTVLQCIVFRAVASGVYQGTVYFDAKEANFKFFENGGWGNEKRSTDYTMPSILAKDTDLGKDDGNWYASASAVSGNYKITINLNTKVVTAESVTLP